MHFLKIGLVLMHAICVIGMVCFLKLMNGMLLTGYHVAASKLLCGFSHELGRTESHVVLLKFLADAGEVSTALKHVMYLREVDPSVLEIIFAELLAVLPTSSKPENLMQIFKAMPENWLQSNEHAWKNFLQ